MIKIDFLNSLKAIETVQFSVAQARILIPLIFCRREKYITTRIEIGGFFDIINEGIQGFLLI